MQRPWLLLALLGCAAEPPTDDQANAPAGAVQWVPPAPPLYRLRLHGIATSDSDGQNASPVTATTVANLLPELNEIFGRSRIQIDFDPATDFETRANTYLNRRFGVIGSLESYTDPDVPPPTTTSSYDTARRNAADENRGDITVFFAAPRDLAYSTSLGHWTLVPDSGGGSSGRFGRFVSWKHGVDASSLAHEIGHYLHNQHTFVGGVDGVADAGQAIASYIDSGNPVANGLDALDGDRNYVTDTPADAAGSIFVEQFGDKCDPDLGEIEIPVTYGNNQHATFTLAPDRSLVMSYFKGCGFENHFSPDQTTRMLDALALGNRRGVLGFTSTPPIDATPTLAKLGEATAGEIAQVKIARIGVNRVVTATVATSTLKLIVWDVSTSGTITRRGDIVVGDVGGRFEVAAGGLGQVIVAYKGTGGGLGIKTYKVSSGGTPTFEASDSAGGITDLALGRLDPTRFITPVRLSTGVLRVIAWSIDANGNLARIADADGGTVDSIEAVTAYHPASLGTESVEAAGTVFVRSGGNLSVQTWKVRSSPASVALAHTDSAGATLASAASELDFDLSASTVRMSNNMTKVIAWKTDYYGNLTRGGSASPELECTRIASAAIGTKFLVTACRRNDLKTQIRLFEVSLGGATVTERYGTYWYTATELALAPVGANKVVLATASTSGDLTLQTFGTAP